MGVFTGSPGIWQVGEGYFHPEYNVLVDASRAGFNFFVIALLAFASLLLCRWRSPFAVLPALLLA